MDSGINNTTTNTNTTDYNALEISSHHFDTISRLVYQISGIDLHEGKEELVKARLLKRLRELNISNFNQYLKFITSDKSGAELRNMVDILTTNKTHFLRESEHLDFLRDEIIPRFGKSPVRIWSAGCSSGEEPYSIAITLCEAIHDIGKYDIRILATDISDRMMEQARQGLYDDETLKTVPARLKLKYFNRVEVKAGHRYNISTQLRSMVSFAKLNLMEEWPMRGLFDVIFCRNVMIYFDKQTQKNLVKRFWSVIKESGYLLVGHSESLTFLTQDYIYLKPAVYQKIKSTAMFHKKPAILRGK